MSAAKMGPIRDFCVKIISCERWDFASGAGVKIIDRLNRNDVRIGQDS
jgi:hypothetical protein